ncbi:MAG: hypothetical protein IH957_06765 [Chloroflexi bacterium]|nr:hypothetical protein [Chloroflexota bacterium]
MSTKKTKGPPSCPACGTSNSVIPIIFGYPGQSLMEEAQSAEVALAGCEVNEVEPSHVCKRCGDEFGEQRFGD